MNFLNIFKFGFFKDAFFTKVYNEEAGEYFDTFINEKLTPYILILVGIAILSYLIGSVSFGVIISKIKGMDVRKYGSGSAGATNMSRVFGMKTAVLTFALDALKTVISTSIGIMLLGSHGAFVAGLFTVIGHAFPVYFKFRGGKGIACLSAFVLITSPVCFLVLLVVYLVLLFGFKMISFASVMTVIVYPFMLSMTSGFGLEIIAALLISILVVFLHRENIARIFNHEEPKISIGKKKNQEKGDLSNENSQE